MMKRVWLLIANILWVSSCTRPHASILSDEDSTFDYFPLANSSDTSHCVEDRCLFQVSVESGDALATSWYVAQKDRVTGKTFAFEIARCSSTEEVQGLLGMHVEPYQLAAFDKDLFESEFETALNPKLGCGDTAGLNSGFAPLYESTELTIAFLWVDHNDNLRKYVFNRSQCERPTDYGIEYWKRLSGASSLPVNNPADHEFQVSCAHKEPPTPSMPYEEKVGWHIYRLKIDRSSDSSYFYFVRYLWSPFVWAENTTLMRNKGDIALAWTSTDNLNSRIKQTDTVEVESILKQIYGVETVIDLSTDDDSDRNYRDAILQSFDRAPALALETANGGRLRNVTKPEECSDEVASTTTFSPTTVYNCVYEARNDMNRRHRTVAVAHVPVTVRFVMPAPVNLLRLLDGSRLFASLQYEGESSHEKRKNLTLHLVEQCKDDGHIPILNYLDPRSTALSHEPVATPEGDHDAYALSQYYAKFLNMNKDSGQAPLKINRIPCVQKKRSCELLVSTSEELKDAFEGKSDDPSCTNANVLKIILEPGEYELSEPYILSGSLDASPLHRNLSLVRNIILEGPDPSRAAAVIRLSCTSRCYTAENNSLTSLTDARLLDPKAAVTTLLSFHDLDSVRLKRVKFIPSAPTSELVARAALGFQNVGWGSGESVELSVLPYEALQGGLPVTELNDRLDLSLPQERRLRAAHAFRYGMLVAKSRLNLRHTQISAVMSGIVARDSYITLSSLRTNPDANGTPEPFQDSLELFGLKVDGHSSIRPFRMEVAGNLHSHAFDLNRSQLLGLNVEFLGDSVAVIRDVEEAPEGSQQSSRFILNQSSLVTNSKLHVGLPSQSFMVNFNGISASKSRVVNSVISGFGILGSSEYSPRDFNGQEQRLNRIVVDIPVKGDALVPGLNGAWSDRGPSALVNVFEWFNGSETLR